MRVVEDVEHGRKELNKIALRTCQSLLCNRRQDYHDHVVYSNTRHNPVKLGDTVVVACPRGVGRPEPRSAEVFSKAVKRCSGGGKPSTTDVHLAHKRREEAVNVETRGSEDTMKKGALLPYSLHCSRTGVGKHGGHLLENGADVLGTAAASRQKVVMTL
jgi:hypothetical protein